MLRRVLLRVYRIPATPTSPDPAALDLPAEDVHLSAVDGTPLRGWLVPAHGRHEPADPRLAAPSAGPAVVLLHGWGSSSADLLPAVPALLEAGLTTLLLDARGHGRSDPTPFMSMPRFAEDLAAGVAWLRRDPRIDPDRIGVIGHSVGAGASLLAAATDTRLAGVVAIASMAHPAELIRGSRGLRWAPAPLTRRVLTTIEDTIGDRFDRFAPVHTITRITAPVLVVHGREDRTVPVGDAMRLAAAGGANVRLRLVPGAGHRSVEPFLPVAPELAGYLRRVLTAPAAPA
ncbi:MAG: alpha/beta hydrolase [Nitriliruptoraceae bacterium]